MDQATIDRLRSLTTFEALVEYLHDDLGWPIDPDDVDELTFDYTPDEVGIDPKFKVKIERIRQIRPLVTGQPWGIFFIDFATKRLPVLALRRILKAFALSRNQASDRQAWDISNLLFISAQGDATDRSISFAHFRRIENNGSGELRTFSWDAHETHFYYLKKTEP